MEPHPDPGWTARKVEERFEEAASILRRLPAPRVQGYGTMWARFIWASNDQCDRKLLRLGPPDAQAISRMEEVLSWHIWLTPDENRLVWMRANRVHWKTVCTRLRCKRTAAWERWVYALEKVAYRLNCL